MDSNNSDILLKCLGSGAKLRLNVTGVEDEAELNINVGGNITTKFLKEYKINTGETFEVDISDNIEFKADGAEISMDDKIGIKNASDDLKSIVDDLITAITQITVTTPAGPSGIPINIASFELIKQRLETLMK